MKKYAVLSECKTYRYMLTRVWNKHKRMLVWVMLNPSTADAEKDDATIRRCIRFARDLGFGGIIVVNLFAYRSRDRKLITKVEDPIGASNNGWISSVFDRVKEEGGLIICAWGADGDYLSRPKHVGLIAKHRGVKLHCLGLTQRGHPRHPLYLRADSQPIRFKP